MENINTDYYYGKQAEQFSFYRIPKLLITDERFSCLNNDAKLLYGLLLDRMSLSMRNNWFDEKNRVYIIYTAENIMRDIRCARNKCAKLLAELSDIGLIERKKRGLGKPDIIYVKNFIQTENTYSNQVEQKEPKEDEGENSFQSDKVVDVQVACENPTSRSRKNKPQEVGKSYTNNTNINHTDIYYNLIYPINQEENNGQLKENRSQEDLKKESLPNEYAKKSKHQEIILKSDMNNNTQEKQAETYMQLVKENIEYDIYTQDQDNKEYFEEIYTIMCDVVTADCKSMSIGGVYYSHKQIKARFLKLNSQHILYVIHSIQKVQTKIHNIRSYIIAALYNAPSTMHHYYTNAVHADYGCVC